MLNLENSKFHIINTKTRMYGFIYMVSRRDEQQGMENSSINKHILFNVLDKKGLY